MGVSLLDRKTSEFVFDINFWHYRAIVEAIRSLEVLPEEKVDSLHESWQNNGLTTEEARLVAAAIRERLLPTRRDGSCSMEVAPTSRTRGRSTGTLRSKRVTTVRTVEFWKSSSPAVRPATASPSADVYAVGSASETR